MASGKLKKYPTREALYRVANHNFRAKKNHSNKDIDPERTKYNRHYGGPQTAEEFRQKFREMIKAADAKKPPKRLKKDRQTMLEVIVWSPRERMNPEDEARWSEAAYKAIEEMFPGQIIGGTYHADEVHDYTLNGEEHRSRGHTHICMIPWTEERGLNMDAFYKRSLPNKINEKLDEVCMEMFGIPYRDGTGAKSDKTVEELKLESRKAKLEKDILYEKDVLETVRMETTDMKATAKQEAEKVADEVYKPYIEAYERLKRDFEALTPKQREKEKESVYDILKNSDFKFGKENLAQMFKATEALEKKANQIEADYLTIEDDDDFELG